jgi:acetylornithine deacetylase
MMLTPQQLTSAVAAHEQEMIALLSEFVACPSFSGQEQSAIAFIEQALMAMDLKSTRIPLCSADLENAPLFSPACDPDNGRYNILAEHQPRTGSGKSVLFNGHVDIVPTGPEHLWTGAPLQAVVRERRLFGRGAGDMKAGIICALIAFKALRSLGVQPAGRVGFNAVLEEENTGNGTLACVMQLPQYDAVIIPEPFNESLMCAQVGVMWVSIVLTGRPAHAAYMSSGVNPIEAAIAIHAALKQLEVEWNLPQQRHPAFRDHPHPINFNLGQIAGGEWNSSVPCMCRMGVRVGFYPGQTIDAVKQAVEQTVHAALAALPNSLELSFDYRGFQAPGCEFDLDHPAMQTLTDAHQKVHGVAPQRLALTATTDARHFHLIPNLPVTCYGPEADNIHGIDESVSLDSMLRVATVMAQYMQDWCGLEYRDCPRTVHQ